jgi:hypothetical protein
MHKVYRKLHDTWKQGRIPKILPREEEIIKNYMANEVVRTCSAIPLMVACQRPHKDRAYVTSALKAGYHWGSQAPFYGLLATNAARIGALIVTDGDTGSTVEKFIHSCDTVLQNQPAIVRYTAGIPLIAALPFIHGFASASFPSEMLTDNTMRACVYGPPSMLALLFTLKLYGGTGSLSHKAFQFVTTHSLTTVPLAAALGAGTSLYRSLTEHPIEKSLIDIKRAPLNE